ncbi:hypothetical protein [Albibacillus kandeliae]|uniref:hypothetical protein n=1 Tax=Albibacillus kandeliae TaxID=2174228 RepID=UPI000D69EEBA|nr:hypothetical protein [Albibacillus kandeliae]
MIFSLALLIVEPISALMLLALVLRYRVGIGIHGMMRVWLAFLAGGLIVHAAGQAELLANYRTPRTFTWMPMITAVNGAIWTSYLTDLLRRKQG